MNKESKSLSGSRTSGAQLRCAGHALRRIVSGLAKHVQKLGLIYGFVFGSVATLCVLAGLIWYVVLDFPPPWKVTDPADPRFDPMKFEFADYDGAGLGHALACLFPAGTPKDDVDKILVETGHARIMQDKNNPHTVYYSYNLLRKKLAPLIFPIPSSNLPATIYFPITFDENQRVKEAGFLLNNCKQKLPESTGFIQDYHKLRSMQAEFAR